MEFKVRDKLNCPNCGMPIVKDTCDYCGTKFFDFANIELNDDSYLRIKINDKLYIFKAILNNISITHNPCTVQVCSTNDGKLKSTFNYFPNELELKFYVDDADIECRTKECEKN